jgi:guanine deaminase
MADFSPTLQDLAFLDRALALAKASAEDDGGPFGALIVRDGHVLAESSNKVTALHDPTAHAEVQAIRAACHYLKDHQLTGCTLYSSCEPCPMCLGAIYWARPDRVLFASSREDAAAAGFDDAMIYHELDLAGHQRVIPCHQVNRPHHMGVWKAWQLNRNRHSY